MQESITMGGLPSSHIPTKNNWVDLLTEVTYGQTTRHLLPEIMYDIYDQLYCIENLTNKLGPMNTISKLRGL